MRHTLLWRQDPEESFSDWKITLESITSENNADMEDHEMDGGNIGTARLNNNDKEEEKERDVGDNNSNYNQALSTGADPPTTFNVHKTILASVSTYFRSLFRKRKHQTSEHQHQISIIKLCPAAIQCFPVFLDFVYNCNIGRLGFNRSNAVALRHLALYFGVDTLKKDISEIILLDLPRSRKSYYQKATFFKDDKLLNGIMLQQSITKSCIKVAPGVFDVLNKRPQEYLKEDNVVLFSWRHLFAHLNDCYSYDAYFVLQNAEKFPNICVTGAGLGQVNGIYTLRCGVRGGVYTNGHCLLKKRKDNNGWEFKLVYYCRCFKKWQNLSLYKTESDSAADHPPSTGWTAWAHMYLPVPTTMISMTTK